MLLGFRIHVNRRKEYDVRAANMSTTLVLVGKAANYCSRPSLTALSSRLIRA